MFGISHRQSFTATGGAAVASGGPIASTVDTINRIFRVHYIGADSHVHELYIAGGWHDGDLTAVAGGPPVAGSSDIASTADIINRVFRIHYAGNDGHVHELSISAGWHDGDLTGVTGGAFVAAGIP